MLKRFQEYLMGVRNAIFPLLTCMKAVRKCSKKIYLLSVAKVGELPDECISSFPKWRYIEDADSVKRLYDQSLDHKKQIEDKAKALVAISSVSATLAIGLGSAALHIYEMIPLFWLRCTLAFVQIYAVFYMVAASLMAIRIFTDKIEMYLMVGSAFDEAYEHKKLAMMNELANIVRTNYLSTSFSCLHRSFLALLVSFALTIVVA